MFELIYDIDLLEEFNIYTYVQNPFQYCFTKLINWQEQKYVLCITKSLPKLRNQLPILLINLMNYKLKNYINW